MGVKNKWAIVVFLIKPLIPKCRLAKLTRRKSEAVAGMEWNDII